MSRTVRTLLAIGAMGLMGVPALAQDPEPLARIAADTTVMTVGDRVSLRISVRHPPDATVRWPDSLDLAPFELLGLEPSEPPTGPGNDRSGATLTVTAFELGELEVPSIPIEVTSVSGGTTVVFTDPVVIGVTSVGLDEGGEIRDVKGPLAIARNWLLFWPWAALLLAAGGLGVWLARRGASEATPAPPRPGAPSRPPHEIALEALSRLEASPLLERGEIKQYHIEVSQIVRSYIEGRYRVWALEMITPDVASGLRGVGVDQETCREFRRFLDQCDLVKFAKQRPAGEACRAVLAAARHLVEITKFVPVASDDPADAPSAPEPRPPDPTADASGDPRSEAASATLGGSEAVSS